ncbi:ABC transporter permease [Mesoplasma lactucae]|uniref:ABC3 transporter permease C-terminal domain-containing protein n=1 Tax=Mesoplasma lactucae ATCC 49193 TaxID=81460 RepID=A0A291ISJ7_9MOLU|nr:FtsX-like permease family protein [Mesoplasma lactucae]ATG97779.1 hypothetical protein CP520_03515 [Mesoplasma lactucae ATCC 49193]ATZ20444.1 hypothetical protein MLACT_v1c06230 [Mesoplasma lactucae ATCC 49193]MCL8216616.1 hypothetical protein [Mesoplasma lactucae ATCC 49193]
MRFRLIFKQSIRDFKSKALLYTAFFLFTFVILSLILGMFSFNFAFQSNVNASFSASKAVNSYEARFKYVDKEAQNEADKYSPSQRFVVDSEGILQKYAEDLLMNNEGNVTLFNGDQYKLSKFEQSDIDRLNNNKISAGDPNFYFNVMGNTGDDSLYMSNVIDLGTRTTTNLSNIRSENKDIGSGENKKKSYDLKDASGLKESDLNLAALMKLYCLLASPSIEENHKGYLYKQNFLVKYYTEKILPEINYSEDDYGFLNWGIDERVYSDATKEYAHMEFGVMPSRTNYTKEETDLNPEQNNQFYDNGMNGLHIVKELDKSEIGKEYLDNLNYGYLSPSFMVANKIKIGDIIPLTFKGVTLAPMKIVGAAITQMGFFDRSTHSYLYVDPYYLVKNFGYSGSNRINFHVPGVGLNYQDANKWMKENVLKGINTSTLLNGKDIDVFQPLFNSKYTEIVPIKLMYSILAYGIGVFALILLFVVFFFIANEGIKLQKQTLWFLKAIGEKPIVLALMTTINIMVPYTLAAIFAIFGSVIVGNIMKSAIGSTYAFYIPGWNFGWLTFAAWAIALVISLFVFLGIDAIILNGDALTMEGQRKVGWVTQLYMKTAHIYSWMPSQVQIGISFIVQNIFKNIITAILLLLSFAIVLFAIEFNSASKTSAQSYEKLNKPYKSLMLNKINTNDTITLNQGFFNNYGVPIKGRETVVDDEGDSPKDQPKLPTINELLAADFAMSSNYDTIVVNSTKLSEISDELANRKNGMKPIKEATGKPDSFHGLLFNQLLDIGKRFYELSQVYPNVNELDGMTKAGFYDTLTNPMTDHFMDYTLVKSILTEDTPYSWSSKMVGLNEEEQKTIVNGIEKGSDYLAKIIVKFHFNDWSEEDWQKTINGNAARWLKTLNEDNIKSFADIITNVREAAIQVKNNISSFDNNINLYFNKAVVTNEELSSSVFANKWYREGTEINGFGLDAESLDSYNPLLKLNKTLLTPDKRFNQATDYKDMKVSTSIKNGDKVNIRDVDTRVHYINANVSGLYAQRHKVSRGDIIKLTNGTFALSNSRLPVVYVKVNDIIEQSSAYNEVFFEKNDLLNYLSASIENGWNGNGLDPSSTPVLNNKTETPISIEQRLLNINTPEYRLLNGDMTYVDETSKAKVKKVVSRKSSDKVSSAYSWNYSPIPGDPIDPKSCEYTPGLIQKLAGYSPDDTKISGDSIQQEVKPEDNYIPDNKYFLNNSTYGLSEVPFTLQNLTLNAKTGVGYSMFDYLGLPTFNYANTSYSNSNGGFDTNSYVSGIYLYNVITNQLMAAVYPITVTINRFIVILLTITAMVALILITLIILENRNTILLFKAMGYKKREINIYLTGGYIIAAIFALIFGALVSYFILKVAAKMILQQVQLSVYFVWSWQFIVTGLSMTAVFIILVLSTVTLYTNRLKPRDAFNAL